MLNFCLLNICDLAHPAICLLTSNSPVSKICNSVCLNRLSTHQIYISFRPVHSLYLLIFRGLTYEPNAVLYLTLSRVQVVAVPIICRRCTCCYLKQVEGIDTDYTQHICRGL